MPPKPKTEAERQRLRILIIDAARELFVEQGVEAVTMREIAKRIGYSATSIYLHFSDKEALLRAICDTDFLALAQTLNGILRIGDPVERLLALGQGYVKFALTYPNHYRLMFMMPRQSCSPELSSLQQNNAEQDAYYLLKTAVNNVYIAGKFKPEFQDSELIAQTIWAAVHGVCSLEIIMSQDAWVNWRMINDRVETMQRVIMRGFLREEK